MSEFKIGDTVDPRTLPVGAVFQLTDGTRHWTVTRQRSDATECGSGGLPGLVPHDKHVILLSLPSDPVELGTQPAKRPPCDACGEESTADLDGVHSVEDSAVHLCGFCFYNKRPARLFEDIQASRAAQASPERPIVEPMSAASENPPRKSTGPSSLPTYDQIAGWLGAGWVISHAPPKGADWSGSAPWHRTDPPEDVLRCYLKHTSDQRVEVTAPTTDAFRPAGWCVLFARVRNFERGETDPTSIYRDHVRWLDPDTKTSAGSESATRNAAEAASAAPEKPEPVVPEGLRCPFCTSRSHSFGFMNPDGTGARAIICDECDYRAPDSDWFGQPSCSSCKQPFWAGRPSCFYDTLCGDCFRAGTTESADHLTNGLDTRIAEVAEPEVRIEDMPGAWQTPCAEGET